MRKKASLLDDIANAPAQDYGIGCGSGTTCDEDFSIGGEEQAIDELEKSGLAAAAAAKED